MLSAGLALGLQSRVDTDGDQAVDARNHHNLGESQRHQGASCCDRPQSPLRGKRVSQVCTCQDGSQGCGHNDRTTDAEDVSEEWSGDTDWLWIEARDDVVRGAEAVAGSGEGQWDRHELCGEDGLRGVHFELRGLELVE